VKNVPKPNVVRIHPTLNIVGVHRGGDGADIPGEDGVDTPGDVVLPGSNRKGSVVPYLMLALLVVTEG